MQNYKMIIAYDGTKYNGWQRIPGDDLTIQYKLEKLLTKALGEEIKIIGSGRTDSGVHAKGQVVNFHTNCKDKKIILKKLSLYLPRDISILEIEEVNENFHSRYNAKGKLYTYSINNGVFQDPFKCRFTYHIREKLNVECMKKAAEKFIGEKDFKAFTTIKGKKKSTVRTINKLEISTNGDEIKLVYEGNGFLHNMIRIITGTLIEIGLGHKKVEDIDAIFGEGLRAKAGFTAPSCGLVLEKVFY